jgi:hypothetical protein
MIAKPFSFGRRSCLMLGMFILLLSVVGSGCLPPPPRQAPRPPTPSGGPNAGAVNRGAVNTEAVYWQG